MKSLTPCEIFDTFTEDVNIDPKSDENLEQENNKNSDILRIVVPIIKKSDLFEEHEFEAKDNGESTGLGSKSDGLSEDIQKIQEIGQSCS